MFGGQGRTGHDLAVNRLQSRLAHRPLIQRGDFLKYDFFAFRHIKNARGILFMPSDLDHGLITFIEKFYDFRINRIDFFPQFIQNHMANPYF